MAHINKNVFDIAVVGLMVFSLVGLVAGNGKRWLFVGTLVLKIADFWVLRGFSDVYTFAFVISERNIKNRYRYENFYKENCRFYGGCECGNDYGFLQ